MLGAPVFDATMTELEARLIGAPRTRCCSVEGLDGWRRLELADVTPTPGGTVWLSYRMLA